MGLRTWSSDQLNNLKEFYPIKSLDEVSEIIGKTPGSVKTKATKLKIKKIMFHYPTTWTIEQDEFLRDNYLTMTSSQLSIQLKRSKSSIKNRLHNLNIHLPDELAAERKRATCFSKGHEPSNKGKKWDEYLSPEQQERSRKTTFKKGSLPHNTLYDGKISVRKDSQGNRYKWIRIGKANWVMLHVLNWEKINGPVPKDHLLVFKNGDRMNCEPENLRLITHAAHMEETRNKPEFIAVTMSHIKGCKGHYDKKVYNEMLKHPDLIDLKRNQLKINQQLKQHEQNEN